MGTWGSDSLYSGLAHAASPQPVSVKDQRRIDKRWLRWKPYALMMVRREVALREPSVKVERLMTVQQQTHASRCYQCLRSDIPWRTVVNRGLDDPRRTEDTFDREFRNAVALRTINLERSKRSRRRKPKPDNTPPAIIRSDRMSVL